MAATTTPGSTAGLTAPIPGREARTSPSTRAPFGDYGNGYGGSYAMMGEGEATDVADDSLLRTTLQVV